MELAGNRGHVSNVPKLESNPVSQARNLGAMGAPPVWVYSLALQGLQLQVLQIPPPWHSILRKLKLYPCPKVLAGHSASLANGYFDTPLFSPRAYSSSAAGSMGTVCHLWIRFLTQEERGAMALYNARILRFRASFALLRRSRSVTDLRVSMCT
jgi:hypothetical protein